MIDMVAINIVPGGAIVPRFAGLAEPVHPGVAAEEPRASNSAQGDEAFESLYLEPVDAIDQC